MIDRPAFGGEVLLRSGIEVVFVDLNRCRSLLDAVEQSEPRLSSEDEARAAGFAKTARDGDLWRAGRIATRIVLERWAGAQIRRQAFVIEASGRPRLVHDRPAFSVSHSGSGVLVAVASSDAIGADIEARRAVKLAPDRRAGILAAATRMGGGAVLPAEDEVAVLQAWVRLEAVAKAQGSGIGQLLTDEGIIGGGRAPTSADPLSAAASPLVVKDLHLDAAYFAAVAAAHLPDAIAVLDFPDEADALRAFLAAV